MANGHGKFSLQLSTANSYSKFSRQVATVNSQTCNAEDGME